MKITLAILLLFAAVSPAYALTATIFRPVVGDPRNGTTTTFDPFTDMTKDECLKRLAEIEAKSPKRAFCLGFVVNREIS